MNVNFISIKGLWYADLPEYLEQGGDFADCQMVSGADFVLELLSGGDTEITLDFSEEEIPHSDVLLVHAHNPTLESGRDYHYHIMNRPPHSSDIKNRYVPNISGFLWLCDVTKFVFKGRFPDTIYLKIVQ